MTFGLKLAQFPLQPVRINQKITGKRFQDIHNTRIANEACHITRAIFLTKRS